MNRRQKIVQQQFLGNEEAVIKRLKQVYGQSLKDIESKVKRLQEDIEELDKLARLSISDEEKEIILSQKRAKVYQKKYQESLQKQVGDILDTMHRDEYKTVSEYLDRCYEDGFLGTLYDLQGQGVPLAFPLDQEAMVTAVQLDSKISQGLYSRLGEDVAELKKKITAQVSRGISTGMTFKQVAQQLAGYTNIGYNSAVRIARTEGHRIQCQSGMDACYKAQEKGANVVKQWDSTLDARTRDSHAKVDGEIRELDEEFSNGLMFPGDPDGEAAEVINCRCALLQRARWAVGGSFTKMNNFTKQLETFESPESYEDFKKAFFSKENRKYMNYVEKMEDKYGTRNFEKVLSSMTEREYRHYSGLLERNPLFNKKAAKTAVSPKTEYLFPDGLTAKETEVFNEIQKTYEDLYQKYGVSVDLLGDKIAIEQRDWDNALNFSVNEYLAKHPTVGRKRAETYVKKSMYERPEKADIFLGGEYWDDAPIVTKEGAYERVKKITVNKFESGFDKTFNEGEEYIIAKLEKRAARLAQCKRARALSNATEGGTGTLLHEYGHALDYAKGVRDHPKFKEWYSTLTEDDISMGLSSYAATNDKEFIAEAFAESFYSYQRPMSKKFMQILEEILND